MMQKVLLLNAMHCVSTSKKGFQMIRKLSTLITMNPNFYLQRACTVSPDPTHANLLQKVCFRHLVTTGVHFAEEKGNEEAEKPQKAVDPEKDRSRIIPPEVSIRYLKSKAYATTYENNPVWLRYRRNHKGAFPPRLTRRSCIRKQQIVYGSPCPICRDEYLVVHYTNVDLLKQFISPYTGEILLPSKTGVCRVKQIALEVAIEQAKDLGFITFHVPFRVYDYADFYPQLRKEKPIS